MSALPREILKEESAEQQRLGLPSLLALPQRARERACVRERARASERERERVCERERERARMRERGGERA